MIPAAALVVLSGVLYWLSLRRGDGADGDREEQGEEASPALVYGLLSAALALALARGYLGPLFNGWPFPRGVDRYEHAIMTSMMAEGGSTESFMLYPPGFHALSAMISNLSGLEPMALFPALAPALLALMSLASYALAARLWGRPVGVAAAFLSGPVLGGAYLHFAEARYPNFVGEQVILILAVAGPDRMYANPTVRSGLLLALLGSSAVFYHQISATSWRCCSPSSPCSSCRTCSSGTAGRASPSWARWPGSSFWPRRLPGTPTTCRTSSPASSAIPSRPAGGARRWRWR
jgi:hypothetical protein